MAEQMQLADLLVTFQDGDEHGWQTEFELLMLTHPERLAELAMDVLLWGIREPILLGSDGRVWDGHHRLCAANLLGFDVVPVERAVQEVPD